MADVKVPASKFNIVNKIMAMLNIGEQGQLDSFFSKIKKDAENRVKKLNSNISTLDINHKIALDELNDKIEDAEAQVEAAYSNVDLESIKTNQDQTNYMSTYLKRIKEAEDNLKYLEDQKKNLITGHKASKDDIKENIKRIEDRMKKIFG